MESVHGVPTCRRRGARHVEPVVRDGGFTLVEIVVAITLMAVLVVPILTAVTTSIRESSRARSAAQVETAIVNAADRVNRAPKSCAYGEYVRAAVRSQHWDQSLAAVVEEHYVPPEVLTHDGSWAPGACESTAGATDRLVQRVTITITSPDGRASRSIQVVKSDV